MDVAPAGSQEPVSTRLSTVSIAVPVPSAVYSTVTSSDEVDDSSSGLVMSTVGLTVSTTVVASGDSGTDSVCPRSFTRML